MNFEAQKADSIHAAIRDDKTDMVSAEKIYTNSIQNGQLLAIRQRAKSEGRSFNEH